ncbi:molybdopterin-binding protein [Haloarcula sp. S1CR25-12]|uniref:Molybdopterin-binding protein n=1 Tax=Haloarcula saliterrae TaxID=2950534 RepID=A0ABU2FBH2_9EURY|nr:molybdopterin-binding protein [Haloarcula sp. S1CR25-12]MDS0259620.1 molybdopterin-binding protein [Haloarcula sp. S1CR25-12]
MVDFQSRDTRRGPVSDEETAESDTESSTSGDGSTGGTDEASDTETVDETAEGDEPVPAATDTGTDEPAETGTTEVDEPAEAETTEVDEPAEAETTEVDEPAEADATGDRQSVFGTAPAASTAATPTLSIDVAVVVVGTETGHVTDTVTTAVRSAGHDVAACERLRGGYDAVQQMVESLVGREDVDAVVTVGGVGVAPDESTIEAVHPLLSKALPGFGEAFRSLLSERLGTGIVAVRSTAGVTDGTLVFCLPGDEAAAELAVSEILASEAPELVAQLRD